MNPQIVQALQLAKKIKLGANDNTLGQPVYRYISDLERVSNLDMKEANFEIKYMMACSQLGFNDPEVTEYVKRKLLGQ